MSFCKNRWLSQNGENLPVDLQKLPKPCSFWLYYGKWHGGLPGAYDPFGSLHCAMTPSLPVSVTAVARRQASLLQACWVPSFVIDIPEPMPFQYCHLTEKLAQMVAFSLLTLVLGTWACGSYHDCSQLTTIMDNLLLWKTNSYAVSSEQSKMCGPCAGFIFTTTSWMSLQPCIYFPNAFQWSMQGKSSWWTLDWLQHQVALPFTILHQKTFPCLGLIHLMHLTQSAPLIAPTLEFAVILNATQNGKTRPLGGAPLISNSPFPLSEWPN
jgi:hypothetical protein